MRNLSGTYIKDNAEKSFAIAVPSAWDELEPHQFATIIQVLHYQKADKYTASVSLLALLFGAKHYHVLRGLQNDDPEQDYLHSLVPLTNFLVEEKPPIKNFFPSLKINKKICLAPAEDLSNINFGEWCFMYQFYQYYLIDQNEHWMNSLIALLYRPADPSQDPDRADYKGDMREVFNENLIAKRAKDVAAIESKFKLAVLAWFTVAIQAVMERRPEVFPMAAPDQDDVPMDENSPAEPISQVMPSDRTWLTVFRELLGPKWGTADQLKVTNAMFVLDALEEQQIAYNEAMSKSPA